MDWKGIWDTIVDFFKSNVWNIVTFVAIFVIGLIVVKIVVNILRRILSHTKMEKIAQQFLLGIIKFCLYLAWILVLLTRVGVQINGIITAMSAVLLAIGMALEANIANLANGIIIISTHLVKKGDYIIVDGVEGNVTDVNFLFTTLITLDNKKVTLPNSALVNGSVTNLGANPKRRIDITFSVAYESDTELVKKVVTDVMKSNGKVYLEPEPFCKLRNLGASSIDFFSNCWVDSEDYWEVYYYIMENVYNEFKRHKISIPFDQIEIRDRKDKVVMPVVGKGLPKRVEKIRPKHHEKFDLENVDLKKTIKQKKAERKAEKQKRKLEKQKEKQKIAKQKSKNTNKKKSAK